MNLMCADNHGLEVSVAFYAAGRAGLPELGHDEEVRAVQDSVQGLATFRAQLATTTHDLLESLDRDSPTIIHLCAHGDDPVAEARRSERLLDRVARRTRQRCR